MATIQNITIDQDADFTQTLTIKDSTGTVVDLTGSTITWSNLSISNGSAATLTFTAVVNAPLAGVDFVNIAEVTKSDQFDDDSTPDNGADTNGRREGILGMVTLHVLCINELDANLIQ